MDMFITPMSPLITSVEEMQSKLAQRVDNNEKTEQQAVSGEQPTFLDVFKTVVGDAVETNAQKSEDMVQLMLGNVDNLEEIQANLTKAEVATELLVTVKNTVVDSYNEIIKMSI